MATSLKEQALRTAPVYRNLHVSQIASYRLPAAGMASIVHRISGALLFILLPLTLWLFDTSITSEVSFEQFANAFAFGVGPLPAWLFKLVVFALIWAYLLHLCIGIRFLWMDATHAVGKEFGRSSALVALVVGTVVALALGAKLFSLY